MITRIRRLLLNLAAGVACLVAIAAAVILTRHTSTHSRGSSSTTTTSTTGTAPPTRALRLFSADSVWNRPLAANARVASDSATLVQTLTSAVKADGDWVNTYKYSVPVYTVGRSQPTVPVTLDAGTDATSQELAKVMRAGVPIPRGATAAPGTDEHMVVLQPSTDTFWEFWHMHRVDGTWHASWGGKMTDVSQNPGYFTDPSDWGATATSIPLLAGLITFADLRAGHIDHALALSVPDTSDRHVWPAQRSDGTDDSPAAIPEGTEFRIDPDVNLDALHLSPVMLMIARAAQRYGMIVRDQSPTVSFYGEQPTGHAAGPWLGAHGEFEDEPPSQLLQKFPWQDTEVVAPR